MVLHLTASKEDSSPGTVDTTRFLLLLLNLGRQVSLPSHSKGHGWTLRVLPDAKFGSRTGALISRRKTCNSRPRTKNNHPIRIPRTVVPFLQAISQGRRKGKRREPAGEDSSRIPRTKPRPAKVALDLNARCSYSIGVRDHQV